MNINFREASDSDEDCDFILGLNNDPSIMQFFPRNQTISKAQHLSFLKKIKQSEDLYWIIEQDQEMVGTVSIYNIDKINKHAEWGRFIVSKKNSGIGFLAAKKTIGIALNDMGINKLYCHCLSSNERMIKLNHALGFKTDGILRQHVLRDGIYLDMHVLSKIKNS